MINPTQEQLNEIKAILKRGLIPYISDGVVNALNVGLQLAYSSGGQKAFEFLEQVEVTTEGDDKGVEFQNQLSAKGEIIAGEDSYPVPIAFHCDEANTIGKMITGAVDVTTILQSDQGSFVGMFGGTTAGKYILVGSPEVYEGAKVKYNSLATVEPENIISEFYQDDTAMWRNVSFMGTNSNYPFEEHGWNIAVDNHESEQIFFGFNPLLRGEPDPWELATFNINGVEYTYRWARFRIISPITGDPQIEQVKLHTDRVEHENLGIFKFGRARSPLRLFSGIENTVPNALVDPVDENVAYTATATAKYVDNEFAATQDDGFLIPVVRRFGLDSSVPLVVGLSFYVKGTATGNVVFNFKSSQVIDGYVYDGTNPSEDFQITVPIASPSNLIRQSIQALIPINKLLSNSGVIIEVSRPGQSDINDTLVNNIVVTNVIVDGYAWKI